MLRDEDEIDAIDTSTDAPDGPAGTPAETRRLRAARAAVAALFLANGAAIANLIPRYPEVKDDLGLSNAALGSAVAAVPAGALVAGLFAAPLIGRLTSRRVAAAGMVLLAGAVALTPAAPRWAVLVAVFAIVGGVDAVVDVAQNAHALRVQRRYRRSIVNSFHGWWSVGAVIGGLMGSAAAGLAIPLAIHLAASGALIAAIGFATLRYLLPGPDSSDRAHDAQLVAATDDHHAAPPPPRRMASIGRAALLPLLVLGVLAAAGVVVEDAGASWSALYLRRDLGVAAAVGGLGFVALQAAMTVGRLAGDRVVDRFGQRAVVRAGGALVVVAMTAALAIHAPWAAIVGFMLAGLGVATLVPAAFHAADELPGLPAGAGLAVVSWMLRIGFLVAPPVVGLVADAISLRVGLGLTVVAGATIVVAAGILSTRPDSSKPLPAEGG